MAQKVKFCGGCGAPLEDGARFCGECGWAAPEAAPINSPKPEKAVKVALKPLDVNKVTEPPVKVLPVRSVAVRQSVFRVGIQQGLGWMIGWIPLGLLMGLFWLSGRERMRIYYDLDYYESSWGFSMPGAIFSFAVAGLLGGLLAGVALPRMQNPVWTRISIPLLWAGGWTVVMGAAGVFNYSTSSVSDDFLLMIAFVTAPLIAIIAAQLAMFGNEVSMLRRGVVSLIWAVIAVLAQISALLLISI